MSTHVAPVLVAVARHGSDAAVRAGAAEAARSGRPLRLVHVCSQDAYAQQLGRDALALARARSRYDVAAADTTTQVLVGSALPELAAAARDCTLLVTERRASGTGLRPSTSITASLAAATDVPLLSVPAGWVEGASPGPVVTGVDIAHGQQVALRAAVVASIRRHATLRVLAASWRPVGAADTDLTRVPRLTEQAVRDDIADHLYAAGGDLCDAAVEVADARPEDLLVAASRQAGLLVLGRHSPQRRAGSRLGPVARIVLRDAACPVLLAAPEHAHEHAARVAP